MPEKLSAQFENSIHTKVLKDFVVNFMVPLIAFVISLALFFIIIFPSYKGMATLKTELSTASQTRDTLLVKIETLKKLHDFNEVIIENVTLVNKVLPDELDAPLIMDETQQLAVNSGVMVSSNSYSGGVAPDVPVADSKVPVTSSHKTVNVALAGNATFPQLVLFLQNLENAARLLVVTSFRYTDVGEVKEGRAPLTASFSLESAYMSVKSDAVTDEPLTIDIASTGFINFMTALKAMKYYEYSHVVIPVAPVIAPASPSTPVVKGANTKSVTSVVNK